MDKSENFSSAEYQIENSVCSYAFPLGGLPPELLMAEVSCHTLLQAAGMGDLLVCETFHALPSGNGEKCNKPLVILATHYPRSASAAQLERSCSRLQRVGYWDDLHLTPALQHRDY